MSLTQFEIGILKQLRDNPSLPLDAAEMAALPGLHERGLIDSLWQRPTEKGLKEMAMSHKIGQLTEGEIEQEIKNKGLTKGPRLTPELIDALIQKVNYWRVPDDAVVVCALTLTNGYTVIGKAGCVAPENFNEEIGKKIAYDDARNQIWALEGYALAYERMLKDEDETDFADFEETLDDLGF